MEWMPQDSHLLLLEFNEKRLEVAKYHLGHCRRKSRETERISFLDIIESLHRAQPDTVLPRTFEVS